MGKGIEIETVSHHTSDHLQFTTPKHQPVEDITKRVLREIAQSELTDHPDPLWWAQWCRGMAQAALRGNEYEVRQMLEGRDFRKRR